MKRKLKSSVTTEELGAQIANDIGTWTPDEKAHARAKINRAFAPNSASRTAELRRQIVQQVCKLTDMTPQLCEGHSADVLLGIAAMTVGHQNYLGRLRPDALVRLGELEKLVSEIKSIN